jgi:hypothetical protein
MMIGLDAVWQVETVVRFAVNANVDGGGGNVEKHPQNS